MRSQLDLPSCRESCVKLEVAGSMLWCITYKQPGWVCDGDEDRDEDGEEKDRGDENKQSAFAGAVSPYEVWSGLQLDASYLE